MSNYVNKQVGAIEQVKESPIVFEEEFNKLMSRIKETHAKRINSLKKILDYIMKCIEKIARKEYVEFYDRKLSIELIDILESIPSKYFKEEKIVVDLTKDVDENILKLLGCYDRYYDYANRERKYNCIERIMDLSFPKMSEGYEAFLDIIGKSCDAYNRISKNDNLILILDEPTAGLDPKERAYFRNIIAEMSKDKIIIISTHIVSDIEYISDQVLIMKKGKFILQGPADELLKEVKNEVWSCRVPNNQWSNFERTHCIANSHVMKEVIEARVISTSSPIEGAIIVEPTLEDLYLKLFSDELQEG